MASDRDSRSSPLWLAAGTGLLGVSLGAAAIILGLRAAPVAAPLPPIQLPHSAPAPTTPAAATPGTMPSAVAVADPLVEAVAATRDAVVNLRADGIVGAGVIVHDSGVVVTNYHVIAGALEARPGRPRDAAPTVIARFEDGRELPATVLVADSEEDLALLRLSAQPGEKFDAVALGRSAELSLGQSVFAIGNPVGLNHSVSRGIVSALDRTDVIRDRQVPFIQLDATINVGNSGGPLFALDGTLVGIVTMRKSGAEGIAFAVPVDHVRAFLDTVRDPSAPRATSEIGVRVAAVREGSALARGGYRVGLEVSSVLPDTTAAAAGLAVGDVIVELRGKRLDGLTRADQDAAVARHLVSTVRSLLPGEQLPMSVLRGDRTLSFDVPIGAVPLERQAAADAQALLGLRLQADIDPPTVEETVPGTRTVGLRIDPRGAEIVRLVDAKVDSADTLAAELAELREQRRRRGPLWVLVGLRRPGDEQVWPHLVMVQ